MASTLLGTARVYLGQCDVQDIQHQHKASETGISLTSNGNHVSPGI